MIKILIADDSPLVRQVLTDILEPCPDMTVAGCACNGREAVEMTLALKPNLVIMDLLMPVMDGLGAIEEIMTAAPTPVLVLSAAIEACYAFNAIKRGALDVMEKPTVHGGPSLEAFAERLIEKVRLLAGIRVIRHPRRSARCVEAGEIGGVVRNPKILAIGSSTGGPKAVAGILKTLPAGFPATVFVVQHIAEGFAAGFATWLARECAIPVRLAADGAGYGPGEVLIAPGSCHMTLAERRIRLIDDPPVNCCRPSIDVFFNSLAQEACDQVVCLLLTGMGRDGALGMLRIKERGGTTLVQDEASCAVFGMPREAIKLKAVDQILPLDCIPAALGKLFGGG